MWTAHGKSRTRLPDYTSIQPDGVVQTAAPVTQESSDKNVVNLVIGMAHTACKRIIRLYRSKQELEDESYLRSYRSDLRDR